MPSEVSPVPEVPEVPEVPVVPEVLRVDADGLGLRSTSDVVVDVLFDGRRIWSFWVVRDGEAGPDDTYEVAWPARLRKFLDGRTLLAVRAHVADVELFSSELSFGSSEERIAVVNAQGQPLGMDKSGRLQLTFETRTARDVAPLLDAIEDVLGALRRAGVEAFPAYGTLLGAVREGKLIGHDSDADLAYVSRLSVPVDVARESYALQRRLADMGYRIRRYSGAGFAVLVTEADGSIRGLDVFGGFFTDGYLVVLGEIRLPFREEWIFPLGTTELEGRTLPAPADPERYLAATYGDSWRVPDPAYVFGTPASTSDRLDDWFRGVVEGRAEWDGRYQARLGREPRTDPDRLAEIVLEREDAPGVVVDVGCGSGHNAYWLATQGLHTEGMDFSYRAFQDLQQHAGAEGVDVTYSVMNLLELRHVLGHGARLARVPGPHVVLARHVVDAVPPRGRANLWRLASMLGRSGGRMYLEFLTHAEEDDPWPQRHLVRPRDPDGVAAALEAVGGTVLLRKEIGLGGGKKGKADGDDLAGRRRGCRMVVQWHG